MADHARKPPTPGSSTELRQALAAKLTTLGVKAHQVRERLYAATGLTDLQLLALTTTAQVQAAFRRAGRLSDQQAGEILALMKTVRASAPSEPDQPTLATGVRGGRTYAALYARFAPYWTDHIRHSHAFILEGASKLACHDTVTVLGASEARDIPLRALAQRFATVHLVDIDEASLHRAADSLRHADPEGQLRERVRCHVEDVTGGRLDQLIREGRQRIRAAADAHQALNAIDELYEGYDPEVPGSPLDHLRATYVVSSGLASQLPGLVIEVLGEAVAQRFPDLQVTPGRRMAYAAACEALHRKLIGQHAETLRTLTEEDGLIYWSDTVAEAPDLRKLTPPQKQTLLQGVRALVDSVEWVAPLEAEMRAALRNTPEATATAALLLSLIKAGRLPVAKTLELIAHLLEQARQINAEAREVIVPGGLAAYFSDRLILDGPPRAWDWVVHPLNLSAFRVEAFHLRRCSRDAPAERSVAVAGRSRRP